MGIMDSRFRGNDKLCYSVVTEQFTISLGSKTVSLSKIQVYQQLKKMDEFCQVFLYHYHEHPIRRVFDKES